MDLPRPKTVANYSLWIIQWVLHARRMTRKWAITPQRAKQVWRQALERHGGYGAGLAELAKLETLHGEFTWEAAHSQMWCMSSPGAISASGNKNTMKRRSQQLRCRHAAPRRLQSSRAHATTAIKKDIGRQTAPSPRRRMTVETAPLAGKLAGGRAKSRAKASGSTATTPGVAGRRATASLIRGTTKLPPKARPQVNKNRLTEPSDMPLKWPRMTSAWDGGGAHHPAQCQYHVNENGARALQAQVEANDGKPAEATTEGDTQKGRPKGTPWPTPRQPVRRQGAALGTRVSRDVGGSLRKASASLAGE